jgi:hypothetical protein
MAPAGHGAPRAMLDDWLILTACGVAGFVVAKLLKMRGGAMIIAMLLSAVVHGLGLTQMLPPYWLVAVVQVVIGAVAGARFAGIRWLELRNTVVQAVLWSILLLLVAIAAAGVGVALFGRPFPAMILAVSPGGMTEMTIMSYALGIETAFVVTSQLCRIFFVITIAPLLFRLLKIAPATPAALPQSARGPRELPGPDQPPG